jgi:hypothetical protein
MRWLFVFREVAHLAERCFRRRRMRIRVLSLPASGVSGLGDALSWSPARQDRSVSRRGLEWTTVGEMHSFCPLFASDPSGRGASRALDRTLTVCLDRDILSPESRCARAGVDLLVVARHDDDIDDDLVCIFPRTVLAILAGSGVASSVRLGRFTSFLRRRRGQDLDGVFAVDVTRAAPNGGCGDDIAVIQLSAASVPSRRRKEMRL